MTAKTINPSTINPRKINPRKINPRKINPRKIKRSSSQGFTYIGILLTIALLGTSLAAVGRSWSMQYRRASEQELLYVGQAYRRAIASYYNATPHGAHQYPRSLSDLTHDARGPKPTRHLRETYADPLAGNAGWELITVPDGSIIGIASRASGRPLKQTNFGVWEAAFENASCFCDWRFVYLPQLVNSSG
jgi:type II secretory pathway pseudopilin PulG